MGLAVAFGVQPAPAAEPTILLVDDAAVLYRPGTKRVFHPPVRSPVNPVIPADKPWEFTISYNTVVRDPSSGHYRIWYQCEEGGEKEHTAVCYAESDDGVHWNKPALGLYPYEGRNDTNIVLPAVEGRYGASVVIDPRDTDPARRYKMAFWDQVVKDGHRLMGLNVAFSPDGLHWTVFGQEPLMKGSFGKIGDLPLVGDTTFSGGGYLSVSDAIDALYDPVRSIFVIYAKTWVDSPEGQTIGKRGIVRTESKDFVHWSRPELMMTPDEFDGTGVEYLPPRPKLDLTRRGIQFHAAPVFYHAGVYFSLVEVMDGETTGGMPIELAISRDGLAWNRPFRAQAFLPLAADPNAFDGGVIWANNSPVFVGDEMRFYYGAYRWRWNQGRVKGLSGIGFARLPLDRFAGLRPITHVGQVTLRPVKLGPKSRITVNADASHGSVRVELITPDGYRVPGYTTETAQPMTGDGVRQEAVWQRTGGVSLVAGTYLIRVHLEDAEVFAIEIRD